MHVIICMPVTTTIRMLINVACSFINVTLLGYPAIANVAVDCCDLCHLSVVNYPLRRREYKEASTAR